MDFSPSKHTQGKCIQPHVVVILVVGGVVVVVVVVVVVIAVLFLLLADVVTPTNSRNSLGVDDSNRMSCRNRSNKNTLRDK